MNVYDIVYYISACIPLFFICYFGGQLVMCKQLVLLENDLG